MKFTKDVEYAFISIISIKNSEGPVSAKTIAVENNLSLADSSLLIWMRANHFKLEVPKTILEFSN